MASLIVLLPTPDTPVQAGIELPFALVSDSGMLTHHGQSPAAQLPKANDLLVQLPASALSWHAVELPKASAKLPAAKLRAVLEGLLEEFLLEDVGQLHFALAPQIHEGEKTWIATCHKAWLAGWLQVLEAQGRSPSRIVPQAEPVADAHTVAQLHITGSPDAPVFISNTAAGVLTAPLAHLPALLPQLEAHTHTSAEPAVIAAAQKVFGGLGEERPLQLLSHSQWMAQALGSAWNLGQFDLSTTGTGRLWQKTLRLLRQFAFAPAWRPARAALLLLVLAQIIGFNVWAWQEHQSLQSKQAQLQAAVQKITGASYVADNPAQQVALKLRGLQQATGSLSPQDLEPMLALLAASNTPPAAGSSLHYENGSLSLQAPALSADHLQALRNAAAAQGYQVLTSGQTLQISPADAPPTPASLNTPAAGTPGTPGTPATPRSPAAVVSHLGFSLSSVA